MLGSVFNALYQFYNVRPLAGLVLAPSALWLSIATVLTWSIWSLNGRPPLIPRKDGQASTVQVPILGSIMAK